METGMEIMGGINGYKDPFWLECPSMLDIGIMGHCHNKCGFCYQGDKQEPHMTLDDFMFLIDMAKDHVNQVALGGRGDPNHHPDFIKILEYCRENNIVPNYTTSGIGLKDEHVEASKMCGAVAVSDYEREFTYDALNSFINAGIKTNIHMIFSRSNFDKIKKILYGYNPWIDRLGKSAPRTERFDIRKLNAVIFLLFKPVGRGENIPELYPTNEEIELFSSLIKTPKSSFKIGMDSCLVNQISKIRELSPIEKVCMDTCESSRMSAYVTPDLRLIPCSFANHDRFGVSLKERGMERAWKYSLQFRGFRKHLRQNQTTCLAIKDK
jgi:MoaA/NifB/PqqE/SkfB family radical SAM enzyme